MQVETAVRVIVTTVGKVVRTQVLLRLTGRG